MVRASWSHLFAHISDQNGEVVVTTVVPVSTLPPPSEPEGQATPTEAEERVGRLTDLLRDLRRRLEGYQGIVDPTPDDLATWDTVLYTYDDALVAIADLLDLEVPPEARDEMNVEQRSELEAALAGAGIDLTAPGTTTTHSD